MTAPDESPLPDPPPSGSSPSDDPGVDATGLPTVAIPTPSPADLRGDVTRLDAMIEELAAEDVTGLPSPATAQNALGPFRALQRALEAGDGPAARTQFARLGEILERGATSKTRTARLLRLMEMKRKLTDTYVKTFRVTSKVFTLEEVGFVISALGQAIMARVSDRAVIAQIFTDFEATAKQYVVAHDLTPRAPAHGHASHRSVEHPAQVAHTSKGVTDHDVDRDD